MSHIQAMSLNKGSCNCGWDECIGLCSFLEPVDEDILDRPVRVFESMDSFDIDSVARLRNADESLNKTNQEEEKMDCHDPVEKDKNAAKCHNEEPSAPKLCVAHAPESLQEPPSERKRIKEKNRRGDINKGYQELTKIIFVIDPELKQRAKKNRSGMMPSADETQLLGRVELVKSAVTTLARMYKDNEVHKMITSHFTKGTVEENNGGNDGMPLLPELMILSSLSSDKPEDSTASEETNKSSPNLSRSEIKRNREKKRRADIRKGLDTLLQMILVIDPQLKAALEERQEKLHENGSTSNTKEGQLLSQIELVNGVVATLSRIHAENEIHKVLIARLAKARRDTSSQSSSGSTPHNVASLNLNDDIPVEDHHYLPGASLLGNDAGTSQGDESTETVQEEVSFDTLEQDLLLGETSLDVSFHEDEPAAKRLKNGHESQD